MKSELEIAKDLISMTKDFKQSSVSKAQALAGDAGGRRYFRLSLENAVQDTVVLVLLAGARGPYGGGDKDLTQDDTYIEVGSIFAKNQIRIPKVFCDDRVGSSGAPALLVEDVGDMALWHFAKSELDERGEKIAGFLGQDATRLLYKRAIDIIGKIQKISPDPSKVIFQREISFEKYRAEINEFARHYAEPKGMSKSELLVLDKLFDAVCEELVSHPRVPSHVDYMSYNLYVGDNGEITVIDFQDCAAISPVRDVVSLINDRDIDIALGKELNLELLHYAEHALNQGWDYYRLYYQYLLHWDFRVSGRFVQLSEHKGKPVYAQWIEGTVRRLGRTLVLNQKSYPEAADILEILSRLSPSFKEGVNNPWDQR